MPSQQIETESYFSVKRWSQIFWEELTKRGIFVALLYAFAHLARLVTGAPLRTFSQMTPQIFLGGQHLPRGLPKLKSWGINAIVNLRDEFDDLAEGVATPQYLYLPTVDDEAPTQEALHQGTAFIADQVSNGGKVFVHCMLGVGRSTTMVAAYLVVSGLSPIQAWQHIRDRRPFIRPTTSQITALNRFAEDLAESQPR